MFTSGEGDAQKSISLPKGKKGTDQLFASMPDLVEEAKKNLEESDLVLGSTPELGKEGLDALIALTLILLGMPLEFGLNWSDRYAVDQDETKTLGELSLRAGIIS